ncbi:hypothetical protein [Streptomyces sp. NPDC050355]|uniref:hypothetical protein n=1 Tax=Streptomyces sp. NPDC050355 TaxID=3365609 RepID=UPI00379112C5
MNCAHTFNEVTWQIDDVDAARDRETRNRLLARMYEGIGPALIDPMAAPHVRTPAVRPS